MSNQARTELLTKVQRALSRIRHKVVVMSGKGGVGKSTVAASLACLLAMRGRRVGLLDADITGPDIPRILGLQEKRLSSKEGILEPVMYSKECSFEVVSMGFLAEESRAVIWRGPLKNSIILQFLAHVDWGTLDYLIIDLPPGTGDEPLTISRLLSPAGFALIVTTPQELALLDVRKSATFSRRLSLRPLGIIENMSGWACPHCGKEIAIMKKGGGEKLAREEGLPFLGSLPFDAHVLESGDSGVPFVLTETPASRSFAGIVDAIEKAIEEWH